MRTELPPALLATASGKRADEILRSCVHCGFCNATCPTYLLLGDELDGPRGRIYLIKDMLETGSSDAVTVRHLDRCLTCRACETTCPSGVAYGELLEIGRETLAHQTRRPLLQRSMRRWLLRIVPNPRRFRRWVALGNLFRWVLPRSLRQHLPPLGRAAKLVRTGKRDGVAGDARRVLVLQGCVQQVSTPEVNGKLRALLAARDIQVVTAPAETCCGSMALHLGQGQQATATMIRNLAALAPHLDGVDAIISTASGCGVTIKDYGRLLADEPQHANLAARVSALAVDVAEYLHGLETTWARDDSIDRVAWHAPCSLQHGQRVTGVVEQLLGKAGYQLTAVRDPHLCCGSAGTYSLLEPMLAQRLRDDKIAALGADDPQVIATANIGCQLHLGAAAGMPVMHWLQLLR